MRLIRQLYRPDGVFSELQDDSGNHVAMALEHAFNVDGSWIPKLSPGVYGCHRGPHRLEGMTIPFETFEVMGVPPFRGCPVSGILFHWGNWDRDSDGCILLGRAEQGSQWGEMITASRLLFKSFMSLNADVDQFTLTVVG